MWFTTSMGSRPYCSQPCRSLRMVTPSRRLVSATFRKKSRPVPGGSARASAEKHQWRFRGPCTGSSARICLRWRMKSSLLLGSVVKSSRARRSCGEAVAGAGGRVAHTLASVAWPSRLAKSSVHALGAVDGAHLVEGRLPPIAGCPLEPREHFSFVRTG